MYVCLYIYYTHILCINQCANNMKVNLLTNMIQQNTINKT